MPTEELIRRRGVRPISSVEGLAAAIDPFTFVTLGEPTKWTILRRWGPRCSTSGIRGQRVGTAAGFPGGCRFG